MGPAAGGVGYKTRPSLRSPWWRRPSSDAGAARDVEQEERREP